MRFIQNADLREWVKESLRKSIFQKAHALAVQTGCEILVKLEDSTDTSSSHYYATTLLQHAYKHDGIREKPGDKLVCGETGHPTIQTVDSAVQSGGLGLGVESDENGVIASDKITNKDDLTNCSPESTDNRIVPLHLTVSNDDQEAHVQQRLARSESTASSTTSNGQSDVVLDFSLKNSQGDSSKAKSKESSSLSPSSVHSVENSNSIGGGGVEIIEKTPIVALLQRPGLLPADSERHKCQICSRTFPKQQLLRDHVSRSHMQPNMSLVMQAQNASTALISAATAAESVDPLPIMDLDHIPSQSMLPALELGPLSYPAALPTFSATVQAALDNATITPVWDLFIREAAEFYFPDMPQEEGRARMAYQNIGKTMYEKYPCIRSEGLTPWSHFNKSLSTKIRWRRQKRKFQDPGGVSGSRPAKRPNSTPSPSGSSHSDEIPPVLSPHGGGEDTVDIKPDINQLNRQILLAQQQAANQHQLPTQSILHGRLTSPPSEPSTSSGMVSPPILPDYGIPIKGLKKNILMQTGFYMTPEIAAMGFSSTLQMTAVKVRPLLKLMSNEGYGIWVEDPVNKDKCGFIKWYPLSEKQQAEVNLTNEQYKRACVAKTQKPGGLSREMEQWFDACGGRKVRQNMSLL